MFQITHTHSHTHNHTHSHTHQTHTHQTNTHTHTRTPNTYTHTHIHKHIHVHTHTRAHTHTQTLTNTHTHSQTPNTHTHIHACMNAQKGSDTHLISAACEVGCLLATELLVAVLVQEAAPLTQSSERSFDERHDLRPYQGGVVVHLHMTQRHTWSTDKTGDSSPAHDTKIHLVHR